ncbi:hypothetical protein JTB14_029452 [Gonioctena quinquepunctata]|nr:hypothetical protein JTB14_029452 [Gonioctena quinquepunctata]
MQVLFLDKQSERLYQIDEKKVIDHGIDLVNGLPNIFDMLDNSIELNRVCYNLAGAHIIYGVDEPKYTALEDTLIEYFSPMMTNKVMRAFKKISKVVFDNMRETVTTAKQWSSNH